MNIRHALISLLMVGSLGWSIMPAVAEENAEYLLISPKTPEAETYAVKFIKKVSANFVSSFHPDYELSPLPSEYVDILFDSAEAYGKYLHRPNVELEVAIRPTGYLQTVKVTRPSGDKEFDLAVTEAVKRAAPYGAAGVATRIGICVRAPEETETKAKLILHSK
jgi:TonB family protein